MENRDLMISVKNVSMQFNVASEKVDNLKEYAMRLIKRQLFFESFWALDDVSFDMYRGDTLGLVGFNGSGKSTLLKVVAGVMKPTKGSSAIYGSIAPMIELGAGFDPELTAKENIMIPSIYGVSEFDKDYMMYLCEKLKIEDKLSHLPSELSGGEQQRVAIARALVGRPQIVFADEPTGNLDKASSEEVVDLFMSLCKEENRTVIVVTHDLSIAARADRVLKMDDGQIFNEEKERMGKDMYQF